MIVSITPDPENKIVFIDVNGLVYQVKKVLINSREKSMEIITWKQEREIWVEAYYLEIKDKIAYIYLVR